MWQYTQGVEEFFTNVVAANLQKNLSPEKFQMSVVGSDVVLYRAPNINLFDIRNQTKRGRAETMHVAHNHNNSGVCVTSYNVMAVSPEQLITTSAGSDSLGKKQDTKLGTFILLGITRTHI